MEIWLLLLCMCGAMLVATHDPTLQGPHTEVLHRKRRYAVFLEGSVFSVSYCLSIKAITGETSIFTEGLAYSISYDLPNDTTSYFKGPILPGPQLLRRSRRDLYRRFEVAIDAAGLDGRGCVLRAVCEAAQMLLPRSSMVVEMLRTVFTLPLERVAPQEPPEHWQYDSAQRSGLANRNCPDLYPSCPVSLLDALLRGPELENE